MTTRSAVTRLTSLAGLSLLITGCASMESLTNWMGHDVLVPDDPGLYAMQVSTRDSDDLLRLDGDREWQRESWPMRSSLNPDSAFLIRDEALARSRQPLESHIHLERVAWVRSAITGDGGIHPVSGSGQWATTGLERFSVPLRITPQPGHAEVVRAVPAAPLEPGLYTLRLAVGEKVREARVGVKWQELDRTAYSASTCVDRYPDAGRTHYRPCDEQQQYLNERWLKIYLVSPDPGPIRYGRGLTIKGVVVNTSERPRTVPVLEGQLRSAEGAVLREWRFDPGIPLLEAGASASFKTQVENPPGGAHSIHVRLATAPGGRNADIRH